MKMPNLAVLYLQNNPFIKKFKNYRKTFIYSLPNLKYLVIFVITISFYNKKNEYKQDDRPVFDDERRYAEAFQRGGLEEEKAERKRYKEEKEEE